MNHRVWISPVALAAACAAGGASVDAGGRTSAPAHAPSTAAPASAVPAFVPPASPIELAPGLIGVGWTADSRLVIARSVTPADAVRLAPAAAPPSASTGPCTVVEELPHPIVKDVTCTADLRTTASRYASSHDVRAVDALWGPPQDAPQLVFPRAPPKKPEDDVGEDAMSGPEFLAGTAALLVGTDHLALLAVHVCLDALCGVCPFAAPTTSRRGGCDEARGPTAPVDVHLGMGAAAVRALLPSPDGSASGVLLSSDDSFFSAHPGALVLVVPLSAATRLGPDAIKCVADLAGRGDEAAAASAAFDAHRCAPKGLKPTKAVLSGARRIAETLVAAGHPLEALSFDPTSSAGLAAIVRDVAGYAHPDGSWKIAEAAVDRLATLPGGDGKDALRSLATDAKRGSLKVSPRIEERLRPYR